ncbi:putative protection of telomeres protein [Septoria linicola]|nr:putative protection of telomeres protein [Septoria linicola]
MSIAIPPEGFDDLSTASKKPTNTFVNVIGMVVDLMSPMITKSGQHLITFKLLDYRLSMSISGAQGITCRSFRDDAESLPKVEKVGDVVLFRNVKIMNYEHQSVLMTNWSTACIVFPGESIPDSSFAYAFANNPIKGLGTPRDVASFNLLEQQYIIRMKEDMKTRVPQVHTKPGARALPEDNAIDVPPLKRMRTSGGFTGNVGSLGKKYKSIEDLTTWDFADLVGFVVKCYPAQYGCDLYLTDYTANEAMRCYPAPEDEMSIERDGDAYGYSDTSRKSWPGPFGQLVMKINVKHPHAAFANSNLREGDVVLLRNVKRRINSAGAYMEGDMWPDYQDQDKIKIHKMKDLSSPEVQIMIKRKEKYWAIRDAKLQREEQARQGKTKTAKHKDKKKRKAAKAEAADTMNQHVRCNHQEGAQVMKVRDILDPGDSRHINEAPNGSRYALPFINARYRAKVRVVDCYPKALEDFAIPVAAEGHSLDPDAWPLEGSPKYEWAFSLLLEEADSVGRSPEEHQLWVHLQNIDASFLLGDLPDPDDLRHRPNLLGQLREKLFILWGNLLERQEVGQGLALSNKPFQCCIEEYGIELDEDDPARHTARKGFQRMYSMFGTTIK